MSVVASIIIYTVLSCYVGGKYHYSNIRMTVVGHTQVLQRVTYWIMHRITGFHYRYVYRLNSVKAQG